MCAWLLRCVRALGRASIVLAALIGALSWVLAVIGGLLNELSNALGILSHWLKAPRQREED